MVKSLFVMGCRPGLGNGMSGSAQRSEHIIDSLSDLGQCDVLLLFPAGGAGVDVSDFNRWMKGRGEVYICKDTRHRTPLLEHLVLALMNRLGLSSIAYIFCPAVKPFYSKLKQLSLQYEYDIVVCRYIQSAIKTRALRLNRSPVVVDLDDDPAEVIATSQRGVLLSFRVWLARRITSRVLRKCNHVFFVKDDDFKKYPYVSGSILPNIPISPSRSYIKNEPSNTNQIKSILFVGGLSWWPNRRGLNRFITSIWPNVIAKYSNVKLNIIGNGDPGPELMRVMKISESVVYLGCQECLERYYADAYLAICPVYEGAGSKIKVLESLAHGVPIVVTLHAYDGVRDTIHDGDGLIVAESDESFGLKVIELLRNSALASKIGSAGYNIISEKYSKRMFKDAVEKSIKHFTE